MGKDSNKIKKHSLHYFEGSIKLSQNSNAMLSLAEIYLYENTQLAIAYYNSSIEQGNSLAMYKLASIYRLGNLIRMDIKKAVQLYEKAHTLGNEESMEELAEIYLYEMKNAPVKKKSQISCKN
eukprot:TRINITY_DN229_c0_g1_i2.p1 TRINITY_DN229_c0_g1~~TRINITY_DN229_c0_g1_i2.p1  ORF type:complete len:123 (-),score=25.22 TRINITY_DN229_c0_g1_i2:78-446(-)